MPLQSCNQQKKWATTTILEREVQNQKSTIGDSLNWTTGQGTNVPHITKHLCQAATLNGRETHTHTLSTNSPPVCTFNHPIRSRRSPPTSAHHQQPNNDFTKTCSFTSLDLPLPFTNWAQFLCLTVHVVLIVQLQEEKLDGCYAKLLWKSFNVHWSLHTAMNPNYPLN